jgi:hypothetical protein
LSAAERSASWLSEAQPVLDSYLRKMGIVSADLRSRWVAHVLAGLQLHIGEYAADDIVEQAVEGLRDAIDSRLARIANLDLIHDRREIAGILVVLQEERNADLVNSLFQDFAVTVDPEARAMLRAAMANDRPRPVRADAPMAMPMQEIALRPLNPLRWLRRGAR